MDVVLRQRCSQKMLMSAVHDETIALLLASIAAEVGEDGMMSTFPIDRRKLVGGIYATVFFSHGRLVEAALHVRSHGAPYLRALSINKICDMLRDFTKDNYRPIAEEALFKRLKGPFSSHVSPEAKRKLADALAQSELFKPTNQTTLFPLVTIQVEADFTCPSFFFRAPASLHQELPKGLRRRLVPDRFPPIEGSRFRSEVPTSWLGVNSPSLEASRKMLRAVLGAVALTPTHTYRHMFSGRNMWGGYLVFGGDFSLSFGDAATPPLMEDIKLRAADHGWLTLLSCKLISEDRDIGRQMTALEYYYRAWGLSPPERFPVLCMALDAAYSEIRDTTAAVLGGIQGTLGQLDERRLKDLLQIRHSVIHGGAPDVYDSSKYGKYYRAYGEDPITDMGLLVAACLRKKIFEDKMAEHAEPHQEIIDRAQAAGRLPKARRKSTILDTA